MASQLATHWGRLGPRLGGAAGDVLAAGARDAREFLDELSERTGAHGLHGFPAAQGVGGRLANVRNLAGDLLLERNQALRAAVLDVQHVTTLLAFLAALADRRGDAKLAVWHRGWETRLRAIEDDARAAAVAEAEDPERAIQAYDSSKLGRAGHKVAVGLGTLGEAYDGRVGRRRG
jgi:hypothetical protein